MRLENICTNYVRRDELPLRLPVFPYLCPMPAPTFYLLITPEKTTIACAGEEFRIRLYQLPAEQPKHGYGEIRFYGVAGKKLMAFVAHNWTVDNVELVSDAITWYGNHHVQEPLNISLEPPYKAVIDNLL